MSSGSLIMCTNISFPDCTSPFIISWILYNGGRWTRCTLSVRQVTLMIIQQRVFVWITPLCCLEGPEQTSDLSSSKDALGCLLPLASKSVLRRQFMDRVELYIIVVLESVLVTLRAVMSNYCDTVDNITWPKCVCAKGSIRKEKKNIMSKRENLLLVNMRVNDSSKVCQQTTDYLNVTHRAFVSCHSLEQSLALPFSIKRASN